MWLQKRENFDDIHSVAKDLIFASLKFISGNTVKSTKSNLKEELQARTKYLRKTLVFI